MDVDDLDDMENFDIPCPELGENSKAVEAPLPLLRNVSFGPAKESSGEFKNKAKLNPPISMEKVMSSNFGGDNTLPSFGNGKDSTPLKGASIASFLQKSLKPATINSFSGISVSATAFLSSNPSELALNKEVFSLNPKKNDSNFKLDAEMEIDEFEDMDEDDLDDIPEPTLK